MRRISAQPVAVVRETELVEFDPAMPPGRRFDQIVLRMQCTEPLRLRGDLRELRVAMFARQLGPHAIAIDRLWQHVPGYPIAFLN